MLWVLKLRIKLLYRRQRQAQLKFCLVRQHISFFSESRSMVAFVCLLSAFLTIIASLLCYTCDNQACSRYTCQPAETSPMGLQSYHEIGTIRCQPLGRRANTNISVSAEWPAVMLFLAHNRPLCNHRLFGQPAKHCSSKYRSKTLVPLSH